MVAEILYRQRESWRRYVRLELIDVDCGHVNEASPYVLLKLVIRNYLFVPLRVVRVLNSSGTVDVHTLPALPENYDESVEPCDERFFEVRLYVQGDIPRHLRDEARQTSPRALQWAFRGRWQVEVFGEVRDAWNPSHELRCLAVPMMRF